MRYQNFLIPVTAVFSGLALADTTITPATETTRSAPTTTTTETTAPDANEKAKDPNANKNLPDDGSLKTHIDRQTAPPAEKRQAAKEESSSNKVQELIKKDRTLSGSARKLTIETNGGVTTIRGNVDTEADRARVNSLVGTVVAPSTIRNELQVRQR